MDLRFCKSNKLPGRVDASGLRTILSPFLDHTLGILLKGLHSTSFVLASIFLTIAHITGMHTTRTEVHSKDWLFEGEVTELRHAGMSMNAYENAHGVR